MDRPSSIKEFERLGMALFDHDLICWPYGAADFYVRLLALLLDLQVFFTDEIDGGREALFDRVESLLDQYAYTDRQHPEVLVFLREMDWWLRRPCEPCPVEQSAWADLEVTDYVRNLPGMMYEDTLRYYQWLGRHFTGKGEMVELGCWLGQSTCSLAEGLKHNDAATGRQLHVFDSFVRAQWMTPFGAFLDSVGAPNTGDSFLPAFLQHTSPYAARVRVTSGWLGAAAPDGHAIAWDGRPIECLVYDLGHDYDLFEEAWRVFGPSFVPGLTTLVVNIYGNARACGVRRAIAERGTALRPAHKPESSAKAFRFEG